MNFHIKAVLQRYYFGHKQRNIITYIIHYLEFQHILLTELTVMMFSNGLWCALCDSKCIDAVQAFCSCSSL